MKILLIDDDESILDNFSTLITYKKPADEIVTASSALKAMDVLDDSIDVIISDIVMPGMDGFEFKKLLNQKEINTPLIYLSAAPSVAYKLIGKQLGATGFLSKPVSGNELIDAIDRAYAYSRLVKTKAELLTPVAELVISQVGYEPVLKRLSEDYSIGRSEHSDISLLSTQASREHACLSRTEESYSQDIPEHHYRIIDFSRNGFLVNNKRVLGYALLRHGDSIYFPGCTMKYFVLQRENVVNPNVTL